MKQSRRFVFLAVFTLISIVFSNVANAADTILNDKEILWLQSRNNTIVVYPQKNYPPYSYQNSSGVPQGLSIDYIELIAQKLGIKISYLPARPLSQILDDMVQEKKGDVITSITYTKDREDFLYFSEEYITIPAVIVVRKDLDNGGTTTLKELSGKKVAIGNKYAVEEFVRITNPRIVIESVVDDESGLQQVVLGEVDAAIMDIASLSYYLSKQVLNSVKVVGNVGFDYKSSFAVPKDKEILQSILDKGLQQVSTHDRQIITDKWVTVPNEKNTANSFFLDVRGGISNAMIYALICIIIILLIFFLRRNHMHYPLRYARKTNDIQELQQEIEKLETTSENLVEELNEVKTLEQDIREKLKNIDKTP